MYKGFNYKKYCKEMELLIDYAKKGLIQKEITLNFAYTDLITKIDSISVVSTNPFNCKNLPYLYISDLYFLPKKRGQGRGLKKFLEIKEKCIENGINEIQIEPILETEFFWIKLGFQEIPNPYDVQVKRMSLKF
jgi:N-acetylglutamate synthase-like GNAT family acetyltransferase